LKFATIIASGIPCGRQRSDGRPAPKLEKRCLYKASAQGCMEIVSPGAIQYCRLA